MELFILILATCSVMSDETTIEENCVKCTADGNQVYYRVMFSPYVQSDFICRPSSALVSKFGYIVDSACDANSCRNISYRPLLKESYRYGYFDCRMDRTVPRQTEDFSLIQIVRDYLEILLLSIMCGLLLLKKKLLTECVEKHLSPKEERAIVADKRSGPLPLTTRDYQLPLTRLKRMKQPTEKNLAELRPPFNVDTDVTGTK
jgi:hypothetical protein